MIFPLIPAETSLSNDTGGPTIPWSRLYRFLLS